MRRLINRLFGKWVHFHWHDEQKYAREHGHYRQGWKWGRAWLDFHSGRRHREVRFEWVLFPRISSDLGVRLGASIGLGSQGSEDGFTAHVQLGFASLYFGLDGFLPGLDGYEDKEVSVSWFARALHWNLWTPTDSWDSKTPKWRNGTFDPTDFLLGPTRCTEEEIRPPESVLVPMPEGVYPGVVKFERRTWKRPRWPWVSHSRESAWIDMADGRGVPVPGKGENSWDCGEDAICGTGADEPTPEAAIASVVKAALKARRRHGGANWLPAGSTARAE
jgi:hypothetical protein